MAGEWQETTIGNFCPFAYGKGLPETKRRRRVGLRCANPTYGLENILYAE